ncbi:MAG: M28 family peptidase, partial [Gemmatimonadetes bacterium]|nr:M28 family peptidase [Gemmatimonadota bacterium]
MHISRCLTIAATLILPTTHAAAQTFPTQDSVIRRMWDVGIVNSQTEQLAHVLMDRIGPRLAGTPGLAAAQDWLVELYESWGVTARKEQYGTWNGWRAGMLHVDMTAPRVQTLEAELLAWSPASNGMVEGEVVMPPAGLTEQTAREWLETVRGKFVLMSAPQQMCRAPQELRRYARPETVIRLDSLRRATSQEWQARLQPLAPRFQAQAAVDEAGALGLLSSRWSGGWGVNKIFSTSAESAVGIDLSCEDYGLLYRLVDGGETPTLRVHAQAEDLGEVPQFNVIAELRGNELPDEYVLLGAHLDSWHGATGATDNGTGTITMLEAMRILKETYPQPRRTILIGHWGAEE